jgi:hypothetical protein
MNTCSGNTSLLSWRVFPCVLITTHLSTTFHKLFFSYFSAQFCPASVRKQSLPRRPIRLSRNKKIFILYFSSIISTILNKKALQISPEPRRHQLSGDQFKTTKIEGPLLHFVYTLQSKTYFYIKKLSENILNKRADKGPKIFTLFLNTS